MIKQSILYKFVFSIMGILTLISCTSNEMQISRSDFTLIKEIDNNSAAYITKAENGKAVLNKNNLIGNTNWILTIDRNLKLSEVKPLLNDLLLKKYDTKSMHTDNQSMYIVYSDTLNRSNAFVHFPYKMIVEVNKKSISENFCLIENETRSNDILKECLLVFSDDLTVEKFVNTIIHLSRFDNLNSQNETLFLLQNVNN